MNESYSFTSYTNQREIFEILEIIDHRNHPRNLSQDRISLIKKKKSSQLLTLFQVTENTFITQKDINLASDRNRLWLYHYLDAI